MTRAAKTVGKVPTGIQGFDQITGGGLPRGRATLVCGGPGCGKTLFALEFVLRGARDFGEPGVIVSFEETGRDLEQNVASLGFDLPALEADRKVALEYVRVDRSEFVEAGAYDLEALFLRIKHAVDRVGAKRVALDTVEALFGGLRDQALLRSELHRLFFWFKQHGLTVVTTGERGAAATLTRQGLEEFVSDCVIALDQRVFEHLSTRHLRVVKYRGSMHGTNEYPFLIDETGFSILPASSMRLEAVASPRRVSSGVPALDGMLAGGFYQGSTVLVSGVAGTGKTTLAMSFAAATCAAGGRCVYISFEESRSQLMRNMRSVGMDLQGCSDRGLIVEALRPTLFGLEEHLVSLRRLVDRYRPDAVVVDPLSALASMGEQPDVRLAITRVVDLLKSRGITTFLTALTAHGEDLETSTVGISSIIDTWLLMRELEQAGERNRALFIIKSRGMAHSNQVREFQITSRGIKLREPYIGLEGPLMGTARTNQEARDRREAAMRRDEIEAARLRAKAKREELSGRMRILRSQLDADIASLEGEIRQGERLEESLAETRSAMARARGDLDRARADAERGSGAETASSRRAGRGRGRMSRKSRGRRRRRAV